MKVDLKNNSEAATNTLLTEKSVGTLLFQGRYIDFDSDWGSGSLLRDVPPHDNHFHLSFHDTLPNGYPRETDLSTNELTQIDLDDFIFELNEYATSLTITPQLPSTFSDKYKVFWRLQDQIGFADPKLVVSYGKWPFQKDLGNSLDKKVVFNKDSSQRYIFIAIARENGKILTEAEGFPDENGVKKYINGACVQRSITIDVSKNKVRWTYVRNGKSFSKVEL